MFLVLVKLLISGLVFCAVLCCENLYLVLYSTLDIYISNYLLDSCLGYNTLYDLLILLISRLVLCTMVCTVNPDLAVYSIFNTVFDTAF